MTVSPIFIDSAALYALADTRDAAHRIAKARWGELIAQKRPLVTALPVVAETATAARRWLGFEAAQRFLDQIERCRVAGAVELVFVGEREFALAKEAFHKLADPKLSFVDCLSFAVMTLRGIKTCFTFDEHFRQAGFELYE